jgi:ERCC4-type nuclease
MLAKKFAYRYTKSEIKKLLKSLTVLIDTREKKNIKIQGYFDKKCIAHKSKKLDFGDYSFLLPKNEKLGIMRDIYFNDQLAIERKASLTELSNNFTHDRTQFENELIRSKGSNSKLILLVENAAGYSDIINHNYRTNYNPKSFLATLHSFKHRYDLDVIFLDHSYSGNFIYYSFYYWLRNYLK